MSMQAVQGLPVQVAESISSNEPTKSDAADFLNILAALVMPNPLPLPTASPEPDQQAEEQNVTTLKPELNTLSLGLGTLGLQTPGSKEAELTPATGTVLDLTNLLGLTDSPTKFATQEVTDTPNQNTTQAELPLQQEGKRTGEKLSNQEVLQFVTAKADAASVAETVINQPWSKTEVAEQTEKSQRLNQVKAIPLVHSLSGERAVTPQGKTVVDSSELLNQNNIVAAEHEFVDAVVSKTESGKTGLEQELEVEVEIPLAENETGNQEIRPFAEYLPKEVVQAKETKIIPEAEFKVPSQELRVELPHIIESRVKDYAGKEISRDIIIHLEPKDLGKLTVKLTAQEGVITVKILTEHAEARSLVETGLSNLRQSFSEQGIKYGRMDVELGGQYLYQQHHQQQQQQHSQSQMRWNQQGAYPGDQWQDNGYYLEENAAINTGRMSKSSGTVDYMA